MQTIKLDHRSMKDLTIGLQIVDQEIPVSNHVAEKRSQRKDHGSNADDEGDHSLVGRRARTSLGDFPSREPPSPGNGAG